MSVVTEEWKQPDKQAHQEQNKEQQQVNRVKEQSPLTHLAAGARAQAGTENTRERTSHGQTRIHRQRSRTESARERTTSRSTGKGARTADERERKPHGSTGAQIEGARTKVAR